jgi:hypothetical protein
MIEYMLISSILHKICEIKKNPRNIQNWHLANRPLTFIKNQNMIMEKGDWQNKWMGNMVMGECKDKQIIFFIVETNYKHFKGLYGRL